MKLKTRALKAFLVLAAVQSLSIIMLANAAKAEPIQPQQNLRNSLIALLAESTAQEPTVAQQSLRQSLLALLAEPAVTNSSSENLHKSLVALLAEPTTGDSSSEQSLRKSLLALLTEPAAQELSASEQNLRKSLLALLTEPTDTTSSDQSLRKSLLALLTEPAAQELSASEQNLRKSLLALLTEPTDTTSSEQSLRKSLLALLTEPTDNTSEQNLRKSLLALLTETTTEASITEPHLRNSLLALLNEQTTEVKNTSPDLSTAEQKYKNYLMALRTENVGEELAQSQANPENSDANKTPAAGLKILAPAANAVLDIPSAAITVQYPIGSELELQVNSVAVDPSLIGGTETNPNTGLITQTWYAVSFHEGENTITAQTKINGGAGETTSTKVQVRGTAKQIKIQTVEARVPADGRSTAKIQGQLLDDKGNLSNRNAIVTLAANAGEFVEADADKDEPGFQIEARQGQFTTSLRSGLKAGTVTIRAISGKLEAFTQVQFETALRSSIVTGVVDLRLGRSGTNFYKSFRDFLPPDSDNNTQLDFHSAVFGTGKIGEWLVTGAYNSERPLNADCDGVKRLFQDYQSCDRNYAVYGDSSKVEKVTPSQDSLYLRFERSSRIPGADPDFAMWGDYKTEEFSRSSQQFTAFQRNLHGFKANYNIGNLQVTGFYANNVEGFQRDTIAPDGTGGYYFLSRRLLIPGSEKVFIELEELNRPGTVLEREQLVRGADYEIDYDRGTLLFRQPILRTDINDIGQVLVRRIVTTYQYESQDDNTNIYAGRVQYNFSRELNHESWLGATYIKENHGIRDFELYGADTKIAIGSKSQLIAEYAHSKNNSELMGSVSGSAYRIEADTEIAKGIHANAYLRHADTGFSNNATISFVPGQTRYGAQVTGQVAKTTNLRLQYDHEDNKGIAPRPLDTFEDLFAPRSEAVPGSKVDNSLTTITAGVQQKIGKADLTLDWVHRHREDRIQPETFSTTSDQLRSRLNVPIAKNLTFLAQNEVTISNEKDVVYPDRTIVGLDWKFSRGLSLRLAQQFYTAGQFEGNAITSLDIVGEHKFGKNTIVNGRYSILGGADGISGQGAVGIKQGITIAPGLKLNLAYEHVFGNFFGRTAAGNQFAQPFATGQSASSLGFGSGDSYSAGLEYTDNPNWQASARFDHRSSSGGSNTVISAGVTGKITPALTALLRYQQASSANQRLDLGNTVNLKLGLAYRNPKSDKFNALLRYEYRKNPATTPESILIGSGTGSEDHTFAAEAIYAPNWRWEFYGKYALRHSTSRLANDLVGTSTISLAQARVTYRLGYKLDLVGEARWINQPSADHSETGFALEAGYYLTPNLRLAGGYAFGDVNDQDFSGSRSAGGFYAGLTVKLNELFDGFGLQKVAPPQQQESNEQVIARETQLQQLQARLDESNAPVFSVSSPNSLAQLGEAP